METVQTHDHMEINTEDSKSEDINTNTNTNKYSELNHKTRNFQKILGEHSCKIPQQDISKLNSKTHCKTHSLRSHGIYSRDAEWLNIHKSM